MIELNFRKDVFLGYYRVLKNNINTLIERRHKDMILDETTYISDKLRDFKSDYYNYLSISEIMEMLSTNPTEAYMFMYSNIVRLGINKDLTNWSYNLVLNKSGVVNQKKIGLIYSTIIKMMISCCECEDFADIDKDCRYYIKECMALLECGFPSRPNKRVTLSIFDDLISGNINDSKEESDKEFYFDDVDEDVEHIGAVVLDKLKEENPKEYRRRLACREYEHCGGPAMFHEDEEDDSCFDEEELENLNENECSDENEEELESEYDVKNFEDFFDFINEYKDDYKNIFDIFNNTLKKEEKDSKEEKKSNKEEKTEAQSYKVYDSVLDNRKYNTYKLNPKPLRFAKINTKEAGKEEYKEKEVDAKKADDTVNETYKYLKNLLSEFGISPEDLEVYVNKDTDKEKDITFTDKDSKNFLYNIHTLINR